MTAESQLKQRSAYPCKPALGIDSWEETVKTEIKPPFGGSYYKQPGVFPPTPLPYSLGNWVLHGSSLLRKPVLQALLNFQWLHYISAHIGVC